MINVTNDTSYSYLFTGVGENFSAKFSPTTFRTTAVVVLAARCAQGRRHSMPCRGYSSRTSQLGRVQLLQHLKVEAQSGLRARAGEGAKFSLWHDAESQDGVQVVK